MTYYDLTLFRSRVNATHRALFDDHDHEEDPASIPAANPAHAPAIDLITQRYGPGKPKEFGLNLHVRTQHMHGSSERNSQYFPRVAMRLLD